MITKIKYNYNSSFISYIHVGGLIKGYIETSSLELIQFIQKYHFKIKYIGATSNLLFCFDRVDFYLLRFKNNILKKGRLYLHVGASVSLNKLVNYTINNSISGFEELGDIPGLISGSIVNNASAYFTCISDKLSFIKIVDKKGKIKVIQKEKYEFKYHESNIKNICIIESYFRIDIVNKEALILKKEMALTKRKNSQPNKYNTLGSTFKRVENICLPFIMEKLQIKKRGNELVRVSSKHVNFLQITPYIYYENVLRLIEEMREILYNNISYVFDLEIELVR